MTDIPRSTRARDAEWPLLERDAEVGALAEAVAAARDGRGGVVLVRAAAGLGKTRLLGAAARLARERDMAVLQASGSVLERDFPFGVVLRLFERWVRDAPAPARAAAFEGSAALAEPMLLGGQAVEQALAGGSEASLVHALHWLVVNLSGERPLVLVVDDLHWADAQSIRLLIQLAARIEDLGVLVVAAVRPREPGAQTELLAQLTAAANVRVIEPRALSDAASAALVRGDATRADAFVRSCFEETGGNPFLLRELLRALAADGVAGGAGDVERVRAIGPEAVAHSVAATLARLGPECAALATAVAVLAGDADPHVAALLADLDGPGRLARRRRAAGRRAARRRRRRAALPPSPAAPRRVRAARARGPRGAAPPGGAPADRPGRAARGRVPPRAHARGRRALGGRRPAHRGARGVRAFGSRRRRAPAAARAARAAGRRGPAGGPRGGRARRGARRRRGRRPGADGRDRDRGRRPRARAPLARCWPGRASSAARCAGRSRRPSTGSPRSKAAARPRSR